MNNYYKLHQFARIKHFWKGRKRAKKLVNFVQANSKI